MRPAVLQLCAMLPAIQRKLDALFTLHQFTDGNPTAEWLAGPGREVRAILTRGDLGVENTLADELPQLGMIAINGVGFDRVDLAAARRRGIKISVTPDVLTDDVADLAIGLMIAVRRGIVAADRHVRSGSWPAGPHGLARKASRARYGIVGLGRIGQAVAHRLAGFGGQIMYSARSRKTVPYAYYPDPRALAAACDVLFITAAASAETLHLIDATVLDALGQDGVLINVSRGSVVDEDALVAALMAGRIAGAGLDVFANEPHVPPALFELPNVVLLPHVGSATLETREAMGDLVIANLQAFFAGQPLLTEVEG